ncbi:hypothetical protein [Microbacterium sp. CFBP 8794]|nr:hypothetical protein [Microbacterium sp. CFBP 8794]MBD8207588.1 hypothetical protein [Microbacterium sp. CFBP 8801]
MPLIAAALIAAAIVVRWLTIDGDGSLPSVLSDGVTLAASVVIESLPFVFLGISISIAAAVGPLAGAGYRHPAHRHPSTGRSVATGTLADSSVVAAVAFEVDCGSRVSCHVNTMEVHAAAR